MERQPALPQDRGRLTGNTQEARPGLAPGARRPVGTMFAALYGELARHPWRDPDTAQDAYLLFHRRALAMGWLDDRAIAVQKRAGGVEETEIGVAGLWGMNDAGTEHPLAAPTASMVAWFQVGVEQMAADRSLPVQPFLRCAGDAAARIGVLRLRGVHVLLPVQGVDISSRPQEALMPSLVTAGWFADYDPQSRTPVRVTLDSGQAPSISSAAPLLAKQISALDQDVFRCESHSVADHDALSERPPFDDRLWNGPPLHRATFDGTLAEWSLDAIGWLGGFLADLSARQGVTTPVLLTVSRAAARPFRVRVDSSVTSEDAVSLWTVYNAVFPDRQGLDDWRSAVWDRHSGRAGFRLARAYAGTDLIGFAYGYEGQPGQWWTDNARRVLAPEVADAWLGGHFELVSIGVLGRARGIGVGRGLLRRITEGLSSRRCLLMTTADEADPARRLYASDGWRVIGPGIGEAQVIMAKQMPADSIPGKAAASVRPI